MELRDYLPIARAHWIGILGCLAFGIAAAFGWAMLQPKVYTADANGYVRAANADPQDPNGGYVSNNLATQKVKSYVEIGAWRSVAQHAIDELHLDDTPEQLVRNVRVTNPPDTVILEVNADAGSPEAARDLASAWVRGMQAEIERIETSTSGGPAAVTLEAADSARLPTAPSSPNTRLALAIGALAGLALGILYAFLRYTLDRRVRSPELVEKETGLTVIGTIPDEKSFSPTNRLIPFSGTGRAAAPGAADLHAVSEAMRELRTNIQYIDVDDPPRAIVVTSAIPGEGKSTTSANLAITLAASGLRVVLIDGDLRRPMIATIFGLPGEVGLTDVLAGRAGLDDVAQPVGPYHNLLVVAAGKIPPNPSELLGSRRMRDLIDSIAQEAFVIVDAPPLIPVTDASVLSHNTDGALVVTTVGKTTVDALKKAQSNLERAGGKALGVVLNRVPRKGPGSAYYGYQYTGDYYRSGGEQPEAAHSAPTPIGDAPRAAHGRRAAHG